MSDAGKNLKHMIEELYIGFLRQYRKFFNILMGFQVVALSLYVYFFTFAHSLINSTAYSWAFSRPLLGHMQYTIVAAIAIVLILWWFKTGSKLSIILGISFFTWIQVMFAVSILVLTLSGTTSAIIGSIQWISLPFVNIVILATSGIPSVNRDSRDSALIRRLISLGRDSGLNKEEQLTELHREDQTPI